MEGIRAVHSKGKAKKRRQRPAAARSAGGHECDYLDLVFRIALVPATEGVPTVSDLSPLLSAVGEKRRDAEDAGCPKSLSFKGTKKHRCGCSGWELLIG